MDKLKKWHFQKETQVFCNSVIVDRYVDQRHSDRDRGSGLVKVTTSGATPSEEVRRWIHCDEEPLGYLAAWPAAVGLVGLSGVVIRALPWEWSVG